MRSETAKQILSETSPETKDKVREYADETRNHRTKYLWACEELNQVKKENNRLTTEIREFKLLVREYFQMRSKIEYSGLHAAMAWFNQKDALEKRILSELEKFTARDVEELPFKD